MLPEAQDERRSRVKLVIAAGLCVVAVGVAAYTVLGGGREPVRGRTRTAFEFVVTWRCLACGHTLQDNAAVGPRACPKCGRAEMYVSIPHVCPRHGVIPVAFQYDERGSATRVKIGKEDWAPLFRDDVADEEDSGYNVRCPQCGVEIFPAG